MGGGGGGGGMVLSWYGEYRMNRREMGRWRTVAQTKGVADWCATQRL